MNPAYNILGLEYGVECYCDTNNSTTKGMGNLCKKQTEDVAAAGTERGSLGFASGTPSDSPLLGAAQPGSDGSRRFRRAGGGSADASTPVCEGCSTSKFACPGEKSAMCGGLYAQNQYAFECSAPYRCDSDAKQCVQDNVNGTLTQKQCSAACGVVPAMEWGEVFLLITFVGLLLPYLLIGAAFQKYWRHESGQDLMPNREFWRGLPGLCTDGCRFSITKLLGFKIKWSLTSKYEEL